MGKKIYKEKKVAEQKESDDRANYKIAGDYDGNLATPQSDRLQ